MIQKARTKIKLVQNGPPAGFQLLFDSPQEGETEKGKWWSFRLRALDGNSNLLPNEEGTLFLSSPRHAETLNQFRKGDRVLISLRKDDQDRYSQLVVEPFTIEQQRKAGLSVRDRDPGAWPEMMAHAFLRAQEARVQIYALHAERPDLFGSKESAQREAQRVFDALAEPDYLLRLALTFFLQEMRA